MARGEGPNGMAVPFPPSPRVPSPPTTPPHPAAASRLSAAGAAASAPAAPLPADGGEAPTLAAYFPVRASPPQPLAQLLGAGPAVA